jgi:uncharacterized membrane protein YbaN (DUF454 family)
MRKERILKWLLVVAGIFAVGLGMLGIFVPILPTTPFLLLAAACFMQSSPRLYAWLIHHKWFGEYIRHYREHRAITVRAKTVALMLLWSVIGLSALFAVTAWWVRAFLAVIAVGVTLHLLHLKTVTPEMMQSSQ